MKKDIHPKMQKVLFKDQSSGTAFIIDSALQTKDTVKHEDGEEYPYVTLEISSASHPFFTGKKMVMDTQGRVDKFKKRYESQKGKKKKKKKTTS